MTTKDLQCLLTYLKDGGCFYTGAVDGIPGPLTKRAVENFQRRVRLPVTGEADAATEAAILEAISKGLPETARDEDFWQEIQYFTREEFRCKCGKYCSGYPAQMRRQAVLLADRAREHFGKPGYVVSGLRCRQHNADVGGVANSQHMYGEAVDLRIQDVDADTLLEFFRKQPEVRYAYKINETNVHFDIPKGER